MDAGEVPQQVRLGDRIGQGILAGAFYLGIALWALRSVLPAPASTATLPVDLPPAWRQITAADQKLVIAVVTAHSRALLHAPATLLDGPQCYPLARALMLGQHEFAQGALGVVPYILSGDPVFTYNSVVILSIMLAGLAMHLLVFAWTGSAAAAFVAGTLFAIHPGRIGDLQHLSAIGNYWTALTLLFLSRLFARPTWAAAAGLGICAGLQTLESIYPLIPHALIVGTLGLGLTWHHRRDLPRFATKLALVGLVVVGSAVVVLGPYLEFRSTWQSLSGRGQLFYGVADFVPGGVAYPGTIALIFACVGLLACYREKAADVHRPHGALVVAGILVFWSAVGEIPIPGLSFSVPSLFKILGTVLPGFDTVRRGGAVASGLYLVTSVLAGYGFAASTRRCGRALGAGLAALVVGSALIEVFVPPVARASFGRSLTLKAYVVRPPESVIDMYARMGPGAVLDIPYEFEPGRFYRMADFVLAGAYHGHRVAACYNSYHVALQDDIAMYAARVLDDPRAAAGLNALGIRNVVHHFLLPSRRSRRAIMSPPSHLTELGRSGAHVAYGILVEATATSSLTALEIRIDVGDGAARDRPVSLTFVNRGAVVYRHPDPIEPTPLLIRWYADDAGLVREDRVRLLFPSVLAAGDQIRRPLSVTPPVRLGKLRVTVATAAHPEEVLAVLPIPDR